MLGELICEMSGKRALRRVVASAPLTVEVSWEESGKLLGVSCMGFGTYTAVPGPDQTLYGEGQGAISSMEGDMVIWKGSGVGRFKDRGAVSYRGVVYYQTASPKFARLNGMAAVFEYEVDAEGKTATKIWEWK
jgi:hypothetical protein